MKAGACQLLKAAKNTLCKYVEESALICTSKQEPKLHELASVHLFPATWVFAKTQMLSKYKRIEVVQLCVKLKKPRLLFSKSNGFESLGQHEGENSYHRGSWSFFFLKKKFISTKFVPN